MAPDAHAEKLAKSSIENPLSSLQILKDIPLTEGLEEGDADAFNHDAYASALYRVLCDNKPPLSIGLFGAWGIGKSTVLNLLCSRIRDESDSTLKYIYFNAWKYSGDSFRRQFLIEIARGVYGDKHPEVQRLEELNFNSLIKQTQQDTFIAKFQAAMKEALKPHYSIKPLGITRFLLGLLGIIFVLGIGALFSRFSVVFASVVSAAGISSVFLWFSNLKFEDLFVVQETPIYDPKLVFPEQFEAEFKKIVATLSLRNEYAVIAIDDIDRCEASVIRDVLTATKNFIGDQNCFFIVPCDERTVIDVFSLTSDQAKSYKDESLRKYFNVSIRIPAISSSDLVDFANQIVRRTKLPDDVVQLAILGNCRDARKMKHFINSLTLKYQVAKARENAGLMPRMVDANIVALAKAVLIEDAFPDFYAALMENPRLYALADKSADSAELDAELKRMVSDWGWWERTWPQLKSTLLRTKDFVMPGDGIFFTLKSGSIQARIPRGVELENALIQGDLILVHVILSEIGLDSQKMDVTDLIAEKLRVSKAFFLQNSIAAALLAEDMPRFVPDNGHAAIGARAISLLISDENQRVLPQDVGRVIRVAQKFRPHGMPSLLEKYANELTLLKADPNFIKGFAELIEILYSVKEWRERLGPILNGRMLEWNETIAGLETTAKIRMPSDISESAYVPSKEVVRNIAVDQMDSSSLEEMLIQWQIAFTHWHDEFSTDFLKNFKKTLVEADKLSFSPELRFVFESLLQKPRILLEEKDGVGLWPVFMNTLAAIKDGEAKKSALYVLGLYCLYGSAEPVRTAALSTLKANTDLMLDDDIRDYFEFLSRFGDETEALGSAIILQQFELLRAETGAISQRSLQRLRLCIERPLVVKQADIEALIEEGLEVADADSAVMWVEQAKNYLTSLTNGFAEHLCDRTLALISVIDSPDRLHALCDLFATSLTHVNAPRDADLLTKYFKNLTSETPAIRDASAKGLVAVRNAKSSLLPFAKMKTEVVLGEISQLHGSNLRDYRTTLDALLEFPDSINPRGYELIFATAKQFLHMDGVNDKLYGLGMVERSVSIQGPNISDIVYLAIHLAETDPFHRDRVKDLIFRLSDHANDDARERILGFTQSEHHSKNK